MKTFLSSIFSIIIFSLNAQTVPESKSAKIDNLITGIYKEGQFMGAVLVAENGKVIFKKGFGYADNNTKEAFTPQTPCYTGSLSKQFTAMGIALLKEKGLIDYEQSIRKYFPALPVCYQPVTVRHMLQHSSGLALFDDYPGMTEQDVFSILQKQSSLRFTPGEQFEYCNANYTLLGMLIEKLSGETLNRFLTAYVFQPCGMKNTYVDEPGIEKNKRAVGYYLFGDEYNSSVYIGGAASVVSTVEDLYKWDQVLYHQKLVSSQTFNEIFTPGSHQWESKVYGKMGYGFGWFISGDDSNRIEQHDGGFAGFRAYIERQVNKHNTIIYLSNVRHGLKDGIRAGIVHILDNEPYTIPKVSGANHIMLKAREVGMKQAIIDYQSKDSSKYYFNENECNSLGYYLLRNNRIEDALLLFKLNTEQFPTSANVFDSMGEAYLKAGDKENALISYKKALSLNPGLSSAADIIKKLEVK